MPVTDTCWPKAEGAVVRPDQIKPNKKKQTKMGEGRVVIRWWGRERGRERTGVWKWVKRKGRTPKRMMDNIIIQV